MKPWVSCAGMFRHASGSRLRGVCIFGVLATLIICSIPGSPGADVVSEMRESVHHLLASLGQQASRARFDFESDVRYDWHYIPRDRPGASLHDLTPAGRKLAHALLASALSQEGTFKAERIMFLEQVLYEMENGNPVRDPNKYFFSIFGDPAGKQPWGWRFEGHHISLNFTLSGNRLLSHSPAFFGANPAEVRTGPHRGLRVLGQEEDLARELLKSLSAPIREKALISDEAPDDIVTRASRVASIESEEGVQYRDLSSAQQGQLERLITVYAGRFRPELAERSLARLRDEGLSSIRFAWAGATESGGRHYYRIQGPSFLIEYDNTQDGANHVHTVWRDLENDFGRDLLKEHYEHSHH